MTTTQKPDYLAALSVAGEAYLLRVPGSYRPIALHVADDGSVFLPKLFASTEPKPSARPQSRLDARTDDDVGDWQDFLHDDRRIT